MLNTSEQGSDRQNWSRLGSSFMDLLAGGTARIGSGNKLSGRRDSQRENTYG